VGALVGVLIGVGILTLVILTFVVIAAVYLGFGWLATALVNFEFGTHITFIQCAVALFMLSLVGYSLSRKRK
jgi:hypothetical protein